MCHDELLYTKKHPLVTSHGETSDEENEREKGVCFAFAITVFSTLEPKKNDESEDLPTKNEEGKKSSMISNLLLIRLLLLNCLLLRLTKSSESQF